MVDFIEATSGCVILEFRTTWTLHVLLGEHEQMLAAPTLDDRFYRDPAVGLSSQFCSSKEELAKELWKPAPRLLEARECV